MPNRRFSREQIIEHLRHMQSMEHAYVPSEPHRVSAPLPDTVVVEGLGGQSIRTGRGAICPEATRNLQATMQKQQEQMAYAAIRGYMEQGSFRQWVQADMTPEEWRAGVNEIRRRAIARKDAERVKSKLMSLRRDPTVKEIEADSPYEVDCSAHDPDPVNTWDEAMAALTAQKATKTSRWQGNQPIQSNKPRAMSNYDKRMLCNDERGFEAAEQAERQQRVMDDLWEGPDGVKHDPLPQGGWEGMRALPALNVERQAQHLAQCEEPVRDDMYDYYFGIADDDDTGMPAKTKPKPKGPQEFFGRGEPHRQLAARPGDTYTDNDEGVIYTKQEAGWKVTGAMGINPDLPERQSAIAKEARQKRGS